MATKECQICGKNSGMFPLCKEHLNMIKTGEVIKNERTGKWEYANKKTYTKKYEFEFAKETNVKCLLCDEYTQNNNLFCRDCYYDVLDRQDELDKNARPQELKDYYFNSKDYACRMYDEDRTYYQKLTMSAIALFLNKMYDDSTIYDRLKGDINNINNSIKKKNEKLKETVKETSKVTQIIENKNKQIAPQIRTLDSHWVKSELERRIDDILFTNSIQHAYEIKVKEITERTVNCDWYIPVTLNKGIYIELWGMKGNAKYDKNTENKKPLYEKHNLKLIQITPDLLKDDSQRITNELLNQITKLTNEIFDEAKR